MKSKFGLYHVTLFFLMLVIAGFAFTQTGNHTKAQGQSLIRIGVSSSSHSAIVAGDMLKIASGYVQPVTAGEDTVYGFAMSDATVPTTSGDTSVLVDVSHDSIHYIIADSTADVTIAKIGTLIDVASKGEADGDASTDDVLEVVGVDVAESTLDAVAGFYVRLNPDERGL